LAEPYLAEIRLMSFNFPPKGWAFCNGQLLPINQNQALFALLGTTYGGNGQTNFALPNLRGQVPIHVGAGHILGEQAGQEFHTVTIAEMPTHVHVAQASGSDGDTALPAGHLLATAANAFGAAGSLTQLDPATVTSVGGSQPHENRQPFLTLTFCIALQGIFPSQN
jgi:microcystin-dependent protein